jgi:hypothetical protein
LKPVSVSSGYNFQGLVKMGKEAVMAQFEILSWHFLGGTEENHRICNRLASLEASVLMCGLQNTGSPLLLDIIHS